LPSLTGSTARQACVSDTCLNFKSAGIAKPLGLLRSCLHKDKPVVEIEPTREHRVPYDVSDDTTGSFLEEMAVAGNTAEAQQVLGAALGLKPDLAFAKEHDKKFTEALKTQDYAAMRDPAMALTTAAFLRTYGSQLAMDAAGIRTAITNKLVEIADCGDTKYELKALELLGRHSDIGLFTERSEVTINYKSPGELESAIRDRVQRLMNANVIDITPTKQAHDIFDEPAKAPAVKRRLATPSPEGA
jgi:hypothetical protein